MIPRAAWWALAALLIAAWFGAVNHMMIATVFGDHKTLARVMYLGGQWITWVILLAHVTRAGPPIQYRPLIYPALVGAIASCWSDVAYALVGVPFLAVTLWLWVDALESHGGSMSGRYDSEGQPRVTRVTLRCGAWGATAGLVVFVGSRARGLAGPPDGALEDAAAWVLGGFAPANAVLILVLLGRTAHAFLDARGSLRS